MEKLNVMEYVTKEYKKIANKISILSSENKQNKPFLAIFQIGNDPASNKYVANKLKKLGSVGIDVRLFKRGKKTDEISLYDLFCKKSDLEFEEVPYMVQLPLPKEYEELTNSLTSISWELDVDGLGISSKERFYTNQKSFIPCTARGIRDYMKYIDSSLEGKSVLIINRSDLVGKPLQKLLLDENMLVSVAHSKISKEKLLDVFDKYDYIVSGIGIPGYFKSEDIPKGCTFIDVGISFNDKGKMCGDLEITENKGDDFKYTPVPNGVGQLTVLSLAKNVMEAYYGINN